MNAAANIPENALPWILWGRAITPTPSNTATPAADMTASQSYTPGDIERELETHYARVYRFVAGMTWGSGLDAEDLTQDVFLKAYRNASGFQRDSALSTWLYRIARNTVTDALRKRTVRRAFSAFWPMDQDQQQVDMPHPDSEDADMDAREMQTMVREAIAALPEPYRSIVLWREIEDLPYREISEITGESEGTLKSRLFYAKKKLRDALIAKGIDYETQ